MRSAVASAALLLASAVNGARAPSIVEVRTTPGPGAKTTDNFGNRGMSECLQPIPQPIPHLIAVSLLPSGREP